MNPLINLMALVSEIRGVTYNDKPTNQITEAEFHEVSECLYGKLTNLSKWDRISMGHDIINSENEESETELENLDVPLTSNSEEWTDDGMVNYFYGTNFFFGE